MEVKTGMNTIRVTLETGDVVEVDYDLKSILANVIASAIENHSGRAIAFSGKVKAKVVTRMTASRRTLRAREKAARQEVAAGTDFTYRNEGGLIQLFPRTDAAKQWAEEHLPLDAPRLGSSYCIEWRCFPAVLVGIQHDALTIKETY